MLTYTAGGRNHKGVLQNEKIVQSPVKTVGEGLVPSRQHRLRPHRTPGDHEGRPYRQIGPFSRHCEPVRTLAWGLPFRVQSARRRHETAQKSHPTT